MSENKLYIEKSKLWKDFEGLDADLKKELEEIENNEEALLDAFGSDIAFGTGGLRGILGVGTNRMNIYVVRKTTLGFYNYMKNHHHRSYSLHHNRHHNRYKNLNNVHNEKKLL